MANHRRIFRHINQLKLSSRSIFIIVVALLGSMTSFALHQWLVMATSHEVNLVSTPPVGNVMESASGPGIKRLDVDVVLIVDWSGSMNGDSGSDPEKLRLRASEVMASSLAADIFPRHTRMGYIQFAKSAVIAQELVDVEKKDARLDLIGSIYDLSDDVPANSDWTTLTNISDAFVVAGQMLEESKSKDDPKFASNVPAIVFLTDGRPTNGFTSESGVKSVVTDLLDKGTIIFVVILRNPNNPEPDSVYGTADSPLNFAFWRSFWYKLSNDHPEQVKYFEAQDDTQLEGIYNTIRARLVKEGTKPTDRLEYNPLDPNAFIEVPPGLLQAHLLVNRPIGVETIELIAPDGLSFEEDILRDPENNEILEGNLFYTFSLYKPIPGPWRLITDAKQPLYYLLITESIYTVRPYFIGGTPYLEPDKPNELQFVVMDDQQRIVSDKTFKLSAFTLQTVQKVDGSYKEETVFLSDLQTNTTNGEIKYVLSVTPEMLSGKDALQLQIDGSSFDGSPVNYSSYEIPVLPVPSGFQITMPEAVVCDSKKLIFWPPTIECSNQVNVNVSVENTDLLSDGTFYGKIYSPVNPDGLDMQQVDPATLNAVLGPLQSVGQYEVTIDVGGKINTDVDDFQWRKRENTTVRVDWPVWVETYKHRTWFAFILLLIIGLWKPVVVTILLPLFAILRIAPSGFYTDYDDSGMPAQLYDLAMKRRKLFVLTIGTSNNADIKLLCADDENENTYSSRLIDRWRLKLLRWLRKAHLARVVAMPWNGVWVEKPSGEFERASERTYTSINVCGVSVRIGQRDWKDDEINL